MSDVKDKVSSVNDKEKSANLTPKENNSANADFQVFELDPKEVAEFAPNNNNEESDEIDCDMNDNQQPSEEAIVLEDDLDANVPKIAGMTSNLKAAISDTPATYKIKYAPGRKPLEGVINLSAIAIQWKDGHGADPGKVASAAREMARVYSDLSGGKLKFNVRPSAVSVPYNRARKNLNKAEDYAKKVANARNKGPKYNIYAIVNDNALDFNHAGTDTAHIRSPKVPTFEHEDGHIVGNGLDKKDYNLGHAGAYKNGKYDDYGDGLSFMSRYPSSKITSAQMYHLGWLAKEKVAQYDLGDPATEYPIEPLFASKSIDGAVKSVLVQRDPGKQLFFSAVMQNNKLVYALHLRNGGGSQRICLFGKKKTYDGLTFEVFNNSQNQSILRISPTPTPK